MLYQFLPYSIVTQSYIYIYSFSHNIFHRGLSQEIGYSSLFYTVGLLFIHSKCNSLHLPTPNSSSIPLPPPPPWQPMICSNMDATRDSQTKKEKEKYLLIIASSIWYIKKKKKKKKKNLFLLICKLRQDASGGVFCPPCLMLRILLCPDLHRLLLGSGYSPFAWTCPLEFLFPTSLPFHSHPACGYPRPGPPNAVLLRGLQDSCCYQVLNPIIIFFVKHC